MNSPLIILRRDRFDHLSSLAIERGAALSQKAIACAAKLYDYFLHWAKWKEKHHRTSWVYQPLIQIKEDLMGEHGIYTIRRAIGFLVDVGLLDRRHNPGNYQDKTYQYKPRNPDTVPLFDTESSSSDTESPRFEIESPGLEIEQLHRNNIDSSIDIKTSSRAAGGKELEKAGERGSQSTGSTSDARKQEVSRFVAPVPVEDIAKAEEPGIDPDPLALNKTSILLEKIEDLGIAVNKRITQAVEGADGEIVENAIALTKSRRRELKNPAGFLLKAIREGWQPDIVESQVHPVAMASNSADPAELRSKYAAIEEEQQTPEWESGREGFLATLNRIKQRAQQKAEGL